MEKDDKQNEEKKEEVLDLSKTVPISAEEEQKLAGFLGRLKAGIKGDSELEAMLGDTLNKW